MVADPEVLQLINRPATSKPAANGDAAKKEGDSVGEQVGKVQLNENNPDEWGEFLHLPGQKFHDFHKIRDEIVRDTEKMTGKNAGTYRSLLATESESMRRGQVGCALRYGNRIPA